MKHLLLSFALLIGVPPVSAFASPGTMKIIEKAVSESSLVVKAIDRDDSNALKQFIASGHSPSLKIENKVHESLLDRASTHASIVSFTLLLNSILASDPHAKLSDARGTPLILTLASLAIPGRPNCARYEEMIAILLKLEPESASLKDRAYIGDGRTALHEAAALGNLNVLNALLAANAEVDARNSSGETPLHLAARFGQLASVKYLVGKGAQVNVKSKFTRSTPLMAAAEMGHAAIIHELMLSGANKGERDTFGKTAPERYREHTLAFYQSGAKKRVTR